MQYKEEHRDLFTVGTGYILAHCISSDFVMGAGIAKRFTIRGVKRTLQTMYPDRVWEGKGYIRVCPMQDESTSSCSQWTVVNLITKNDVHDKPTYETLEQSLIELKEYMVSRTLMRLAIPKIGCGLDGLEWNRVHTIIMRLFADTNIDILVCDWP